MIYEKNNQSQIIYEKNNQSQIIYEKNNQLQMTDEKSNQSQIIDEKSNQSQMIDEKICKPQMIDENIFKSKQLFGYYREGKLDIILGKYENYLNIDNFIGGGVNAAVFKYRDLIYKLSSKEIRYFKSFN